MLAYLTFATAPLSPSAWAALRFALILFRADWEHRTCCRDDRMGVA